MEEDKRRGGIIVLLGKLALAVIVMVGLVGAVRWGMRWQARRDAPIIKESSLAGRIAEVSPNMVLWNEHHEGSDSTYWLAWEALNDDEPGGKDDFSRTMYMIWEDSARYFTSIGPVTSEEEQWEQVGTCTVVLIAAWDVVTWDHEPSTVVVQVVYLSMNQFRVNQVLREARVDDNGITDLIHERGFGYLPEYTDLYAGPGGDGLEHARSGAKKRR